MIFNLMKPVPVQTATMYLYGHEADKTVTYNGVELPELPVWDKTAYPYAMIGNKEQSLSGLNILYVCNNPFLGRADDTDSVLMQKNSNCNYYSVENGEWVYVGVITVPDVGITSMAMPFPIWSNTDIEYAIKASDPVITYTNADVTINGVGYVGAVLPKLPEWDKTAYPYAIIGYSNVRENYVLKVSKEPNTANENGKGAYVGGTDSILFEVSESEWTSASAGAFQFSIIWANHDVYYGLTTGELEGTLFLAKSDPVPVYE